VTTEGKVSVAPRLEVGQNFLGSLEGNQWLFRAGTFTRA